jgi:hypothetical protein
MAAEIRFYREGDEEGIVRLFSGVFARKMTLEEWRWKYTGQGNAKVYSAVIEDAAEGIVGHYGGIPLRMLRKGEQTTGVSTCDVMIHPRFRSFVRLKKLHNFFTDNHVKDSLYMLYGFPTEQTLMIPADKLHLYERIEVVQEGKKDATFHGGPDRFLYKLFPIDYDDLRIDDLWDNINGRFGLVVIRDRSFFRWRYRDNPLFTYELWGLRKRWEQKLLGLAVVKREGDGSMRIMDLLSRDGMLPVLLRKVGNMACSAGVKQLVLWAPGRIRRVLTDEGYALVKTGTTLPRSTHPLSIKKEEILSSFFYSAGDTDYL